MGKRGPKPGTGGRPIQYDDPYHIIMRLRQREYARRMREAAEHSKPEVLEVLA
jgi:hypothetical protein